MSTAELGTLMASLTALISAAIATYRSIRKDKVEETVEVRSAALRELEISLSARAADYQRVLNEVVDLRARVDTLRDRLKEELDRVERLVRENGELRERVRQLEENQRHA